MKCILARVVPPSVSQQRWPHVLSFIYLLCRFIFFFLKFFLSNFFLSNFFLSKFFLSKLFFFQFFLIQFVFLFSFFLIQFLLIFPILVFLEDFFSHFSQKSINHPYHAVFSCIIILVTISA